MRTNIKLQRAASVENQQPVRALFCAWLHQCACGGNRSIEDRMDTISARARARGLSAEQVKHLFKNDF